MATLTASLSQLSSHPDKALINAITMLSEDCADSLEGARAFYGVIKGRLLDREIDHTLKLPLVYLLDSILHNAGNFFRTAIEEDVVETIPRVYEGLRKADRGKVERLVGIWKDGSVFGDCVIRGVKDGVDRHKGVDLPSLSESDKKALKEMLEEVYAELAEDAEETEDFYMMDLEELDNVNPGLLKQMHSNLRYYRDNAPARGDRELKAASSHCRGVKKALDSSLYNSAVSYFAAAASKPSRGEDRGAKTVGLNGAAGIDNIGGEDYDLLVAAGEKRGRTLNSTFPFFARAFFTFSFYIFDTFSSSFFLTPSPEIAASSKYLETLLEDYAKAPSRDFISADSAATDCVDPSDFTSEGLGPKTKVNEKVFFTLYYALPFHDAETGLRFRTQLMLNNHLDYKFKKSQDGGDQSSVTFHWYKGDDEWCSASYDDEVGQGDSDDQANSGGDLKREHEGEEKYRVEADEARQKCKICGKEVSFFTVINAIIAAARPLLLLF